MRSNWIFKATFWVVDKDTLKLIEHIEPIEVNFDGSENEDGLDEAVIAWSAAVQKAHDRAKEIEEDSINTTVDLNVIKFISC